MAKTKPLPAENLEVIAFRSLSDCLRENISHRAATKCLSDLSRLGFDVTVNPKWYQRMKANAYAISRLTPVATTTVPTATPHLVDQPAHPLHA